MTDWEKRARELRIKAEEETKWRLMGFPLPGIEWALQLGREMADERAEEIAVKIGHAGAVVEGTAPATIALTVAARCARIARSFLSRNQVEPSISKKPKDLSVLEDASSWSAGEDLQKGDIVELRDGAWWKVRPKPKTREEALEEALRKINDPGETNSWLDCAQIAKRALEWRPEGEK